MSDLNALLQKIRECDEEMKSAHNAREHAEMLYTMTRQELAEAQLAFDKAVAAARGVDWVAPAEGSRTGASAPTEAVPAANVPVRDHSTTRFAPPLPPPVPVGPHADTGRGPGYGNFTNDDDRPEGIGG